VLIIISRQLVEWTYTKAWLQKAREKVEQEVDSRKEDFEWRERIRSAQGWHLVRLKLRPSIRSLR